MILQRSCAMALWTLAIVVGREVRAIEPTADELQIARQWAAGFFGPSADAGKSSGPEQCFSFLYDNRKSDELLKQWRRTSTKKPMAGHRVKRTVTYSDRQTGLQVRCVAVEYADFPVVEWTVYLKNTGNQDTPILETVLGLDMSLLHDESREFLLHGIKGDWCVAESFQPYRLTLGPSLTKTFSPPNYSGIRPDICWQDANWYPSGDPRDRPIRPGMPLGLTRSRLLGSDLAGLPTLLLDAPHPRFRNLEA